MQYKIGRLLMDDVMNRPVTLSQENPVQVEEVRLLRIVNAKLASQKMGLPAYYIRRLCKEVSDIAFQSGVKWYISLGKMAEYFNNK